MNILFIILGVIIAECILPTIKSYLKEYIKYLNSKEKTIKDIKKLCKKKNIKVPNELEGRVVWALKEIKKDIKNGEYSN